MVKSRLGHTPAAVENLRPKSSAGEKAPRKITSTINYLRAVDSHFHLDRCLKRLRFPANTSVHDLIHHRIGAATKVSVIVVVGVAVFCDAPNIPEALCLPSGLGAAVGLHPRNADRFSDDVYCLLRGALEKHDVVILGAK